MTILLLFCALTVASPASSREFGTQGHTYAIKEPDLLQQITQKLMALDESGSLARHNRLMLEKAEKGIRRPAPVVDITKSTELREFFYDPSLTVPFDLKDHKGRVFHKKGTKVNPLKHISLSHSLIFIDGDDEQQVAWASQKKKVKIILVSGSPFGLMEAWNRPIFFDQEGRLTSKLGIRQVPAVVSQEGLKLKISEVVLEGQP